MRKEITLKEVAERGLDIYSLLNVDRETKQLKRKTTPNHCVDNVVEISDVELEIPQFNTPQAKRIREIVRTMRDMA